MLLNECRLIELLGSIFPDNVDLFFFSDRFLFDYWMDTLKWAQEQCW